jgi:hypothetical protein
VGGVFRGGFQGVDHDLFHLLVGDLPGGAGSGFVGQAVEPVRDEPGPPFPDGRARNPQPLGHLGVVSAGGAFPHDARTQRQLLGAFAAGRIPPQGFSFFVGQHEFGLGPPRFRHTRIIRHVYELMRRKRVKGSSTN